MGISFSAWICIILGAIALVLIIRKVVSVVHEAEARERRKKIAPEDYVRAQLYRQRATSGRPIKNVKYLETKRISNNQYAYSAQMEDDFGDIFYAWIYYDMLTGHFDHQPWNASCGDFLCAPMPVDYCFPELGSPDICCSSDDDKYARGSFDSSFDSGCCHSDSSFDFDSSDSSSDCGGGDFGGDCGGGDCGCGD